MRRITLEVVLGATLLAAVTAAPVAGSRAASIGPHVYSTKIVGAKPALLDGTWRLTVQDRSEGDAGHLDSWSLHLRAD